MTRTVTMGATKARVNQLVERRARPRIHQGGPWRRVRSVNSTGVVSPLSVSQVSHAKSDRRVHWATRPRPQFREPGYDAVSDRLDKRLQRIFFEMSEKAAAPKRSKTTEDGSGVGDVMVRTPF